MLVQGSTTIVRGLQTRLIWTPGTEGGTFPEEGNFGGAVTDPPPPEEDWAFPEEGGFDGAATDPVPKEGAG